MTTLNLLKKQGLAWKYLLDSSTTEILYGGAAGGGKSFLGSVWLTLFSLKYSGTRWLMGRAVLKNLKDSTLLTLFEVFKLCGLDSRVHYNYNAQANKITFLNGSEIYLRDLFQNPSDPEFDSLGSTEFTGAFIDEASQITEKAKNTVISRLRFKHNEYKLIPKLLVCSNPYKNFLYYDFYKPSKDGMLSKNRAFISANVDDNRHLPESYKSNLLNLDKQTRDRLLYGNWDYVDDPTVLMTYESIISLFGNTEMKDSNMYISCDVARFGADKTIIYVWDGLHLFNATEISKSTLKEVREFILELSNRFKVPLSHIIVDEDGVGGGLVDELGVKGFVNNSKALNDDNYLNLKSQCYYKLAELVNAGKISIYKEIPIKIKEGLIADLEQVKRKDADKDGKLAVIGKEKIKEVLGRSPDYSDALMMRVYFEMRRMPEPSIFGTRIYS